MTARGAGAGRKGDAAEKTGFVEQGAGFRMDLERDADVTLALLIIAHYAHKWVRHLAAAAGKPPPGVEEQQRR